MFRIMVIDDEAIVREAVATQINWEQYGICVVRTCENAIDALSYLQDHDADLLLVDIRLPVMDGLELVRRVREIKPQIMFIMISGYADFEYARQAMRYGAQDYLLKPLNDASLLHAVRHAQEICERHQFLDRVGQLGLRFEEPEVRTTCSPTVTQLLHLVDEQIANPELSLKWISSEHMFLNETYLSKLFQKEVGQKFSSYLSDRRMQLAMRLMLRSPDALIGEVAEATGFGDNREYFSIVFKKYTGLTPTEFRKKLTGHDPV